MTEPATFRQEIQQAINRHRRKVVSRIDCYAAPDKEACAKNAKMEPEGERIRGELIDFLARNKIVSILLDTDEHIVSIDIAWPKVKLPLEIKPVLTLWGSIFVRNDVGDPPKGEAR